MSIATILYVGFWLLLNYFIFVDSSSTVSGSSASSPDHLNFAEKAIVVVFVVIIVAVPSLVTIVSPKLYLLVGALEACIPALTGFPYYAHYPKNADSDSSIQALLAFSAALIVLIVAPTALTRFLLAKKNRKHELNLPIKDSSVDMSEFVWPPRPVLTEIDERASDKTLSAEQQESTLP